MNTRRPDPSSTGPFQDDPKPVLAVCGGIHSFLKTHRASITGDTPQGPRFLPAQEVVRSEVLFRNGLNRPTRACHLVWTHGKTINGPALTASHLILSN
jgi:hypothetical protein